MQAEAGWRSTASLEEKKGIWFPDGARIYAVDQMVGPQACAERSIECSFACRQVVIQTGRITTGAQQAFLLFVIRSSALDFLDRKSVV